jgi:hypothetical protein
MEMEIAVHLALLVGLIPLVALVAVEALVEEISKVVLQV